LSCPVFAHSPYMNHTAAFDYVFYDSILSSKNHHLHYPGFFAKSTGTDFETRLSLSEKASLSSPYPLYYKERSSIIFHPQQKRINYRRASIIGLVNAGATFFGFKQAIACWGKSNSGFHFKDDWKGDNLTQTDELSHFMWGYKMTQFFLRAYDWVGLSSKTSQALSISQSALLLTLVEYPIDAYNPKQGFGVSDLIFDYMGIGLACVKENKSWLEDFDVKISWKRNIFLANQPMFAQTYEEFGNFVYWLTYRTKLFLPQKIFCFGVGYSVTHDGQEPKRQFFGGIGLSLPDFASLFGRKFEERVKFLGIFYPNLCLEF